MGVVVAGVAAGTGTALVLYRALAGLSAMVDLSVVVSFRRLCAAYLLIRRRDGGRQRVYRLRRGDRRLAMAGATDASTSASRSPRCCARFSTTSQPSRSEEQTSELQSLLRTSYAVFCLK